MVASRRDDPQGTRFRAMSHEEQATFLEQAVQEISRHLGGAVAYELDEEISDPKKTLKLWELTRNPRTNQGSSGRSSCTRKGYVVTSANRAANEMDAG
jgi:hypothetical protein